MRARKSVVVAATLGLASGPSWACELDPFLFQLPGETEADAHERSDRIIDDHQVVQLYKREISDFESAKSIYLARVIERSHTTKLHPIAALKGSLPPVDQTLTGMGAGGTCTDTGDGLGTFSAVGSLIVVFEGVPKTHERPRGIDSFPAKAIRTIPLLDQLRRHGKDLED